MTLAAVLHVRNLVVDRRSLLLHVNSHKSICHGQNCTKSGSRQDGKICKLIVYFMAPFVNPVISAFDLLIECEIILRKGPGTKYRMKFYVTTSFHLIVLTELGYR